MTLAIDQMQTLLQALNGPRFDYHPLSIMADAVHALETELHRRKHGPFTLAEAIASGKPFRRKAWGDDPSFCRLAKDCSSSWFDFGWQTDCIGSDDITATDYELQEGGE